MFPPEKNGADTHIPFCLHVKINLQVEMQSIASAKNTLHYITYFIKTPVDANVCGSFTHACGAH
jgi:hypothetical protein